MKSSVLKFFALIFFLSLTIFVSAQVTPINPDDNDNTSDNTTKAKNDSWASKIIVGGNIGAQFGDITAIDVSPLIGYRVTDKLTPGVGFTYQYISFHDPYGFYTSYKATVIGGRVFTQYDLIYGLFAHAEFENLWYNISYENDIYPPASGNEPGLFIGPGYNLQIGGRSYFQLMALYNVLWMTDNVIYSNSWQFRFGFNIGL